MCLVIVVFVRKATGQVVFIEVFRLVHYYFVSCTLNLSIFWLEKLIARASIHSENLLISDESDRPVRIVELELFDFLPVEGVPNELLILQQL